MYMREEDYARQLRKPEGSSGIEVAQRMNRLNNLMYTHCFQWFPQKAFELLEIGPGNALAAASLLQERPEINYTGIDHAPDMVAEGKLQLDKFGDRASYVLGNAERLPFPDARYDVLLSINTLYFVTEPEAVLSEWARVLKPGGMICIGLRSKESMESLGLHQYGFQLFKSESLCALLEQSGIQSCQTMEISEPEREINGHTRPMFSFICAGIKAE
jgi:ubiquinone/menaquinone biosynthesis C-methylase UbiE